MSKHDTHQLIIDSAMREIRDASLSDILSFLAPARLARRSHDLCVRPLSAPTVAAHFAVPESARQFDRNALVEELFDRACERMEDITQASARVYLSAAEAAQASRSAGPMHGAIADDMANYQPGTNTEPEDDARLRVYYLAMATCEDGSDLASKLRATDANIEETYRGVYEEFLRLTGRQVIDGYTVRDLSVLVRMLLNGHEIRHRYGNALPMERVGDALMRTFWAFTTPLETPTLDIEAELIASLGTS